MTASNFRAECRSYKVEWTMTGTLTITLHPDETPDGIADVKRIVEQGDDINLLGASEIDGVRVDEVDGQHVHTWINLRETLGPKLPNEDLCLSCRKTVTK